MCRITFRHGGKQLRSHNAVHGYIVLVSCISLLKPISGNSGNATHCEPRYSIL